MSIVITSPVAGSLKINWNGNSSYLADLFTVIIQADISANYLNILNKNNDLLFGCPASSITTIGSVTQKWDAQTAADAIASFVQSGSNPIPPVTNGFVADFNFGDAKTVSQSNGKAASITDKVQGIVNSQATQSQQPAYFTNGGPNGNGYALFTGVETLSGALITNSTAFTEFIVYYVDSSVADSSYMGVCQNGNGSTGWGMVDLYSQWKAIYFPGEQGDDFKSAYSYRSKWQVVAISSGSSGNFLYNTAGVKFLSGAADTAITPSGGNVIGNVVFNGATTIKMIGGIGRRLVYNRQFSDSEVQQNINYLKTGLPMPVNACTYGDSRMNNVGGSPTCPQQILTQAIAAGSPYLYYDNQGVNGATVAQLVTSYPDLVRPQYNTVTKNVMTIMAGINSVFGGTSATDIYNGIVQICQLARADGYKVVVCTDMYTSNATDAAIQDQYNAPIRSNWATFADALCDINALPQATVSNMANATYSPDGIHPTPLLAGFMATPLLSSINSLI